MAVQLMMSNMKKNNRFNLFYISLLIWVVYSCNSSVSTSKSLIKKNLITLDSCLYFQVDSTAKCFDCESYLEYCLTINNTYEQPTVFYSRQNNDRNFASSFQINNEELLFDGLSDISDSIIIMPMTKKTIILQPQIERIKFKDMSYEKYDSYLLNMSRHAKIIYIAKDKKIEVERSNEFILIQKKR